MIKPFVSNELNNKTQYRFQNSEDELDNESTQDPPKEDSFLRQLLDYSHQKTLENVKPQTHEKR